MNNKAKRTGEEENFKQIYEKDLGLPPCYSTLSRILRYREENESYKINDLEFAIVVDGKKKKNLKFIKKN